MICVMVFFSQTKSGKARMQLDTGCSKVEYTPRLVANMTKSKDLLQILSAGNITRRFFRISYSIDLNRLNIEQRL